MEHKIKLGAVIEFDEEKEADIINTVESLRDRHKLGDFISYAIRISLEHPEWFDSKDITLASFGITDTRRAFFDSINSKLIAMERKVDTIYNMALSTYTLAKFGKRIGIEKKSENLLQTSFILQRQLDEITTTLGVSSVNHIYESNKLDTLSKKVDELLEYIIESYDSIVLELKNGVIREIDLGYREVPASTAPPITPIETTTKTDTTTVESKPITQDKQEDTHQENSSEGTDEASNDEIIDFGGGGVDLSALENFFG